MQSRGFSFSALDAESKLRVLESIGYGTDGTFVTRHGKPYRDQYTHQPIRLTEVIVLPGSTVVLSDNPISLAMYLEDHPDVQIEY